MGYGPETNTFKAINNREELEVFRKDKPQFLFTVGEEVTLKGVRFKVHDIGDSRIVLKPLSPA